MINFVLKDINILIFLFVLWLLLYHLGCIYHLQWIVFTRVFPPCLWMYYLVFRKGHITHVSHYPKNIFTSLVSFTWKKSNICFIGFAYHSVSTIMAVWYYSLISCLSTEPVPCIVIPTQSSMTHLFLPTCLHTSLALDKKWIYKYSPDI